MMNGELGKIICQHCGFTDYVTEKEWNGPHGGVWAFGWWNGTNKSEPCLCPKCGGKICSGNGLVGLNLQSGHFGVLVVRDEKAFEEKAQVVT